MDQKKTILYFLKTQRFCVVATIGPESRQPEAAVVTFVEKENLELIFGTFLDSRKFANLVSNPAVSFVIGWDDYTVQYEGVGRVLEGAEADSARDALLAKNPDSKKYAFEEKQRYILVSPRWIRFSDFSIDPESVFEVTFSEVVH